MGEIAKRSAIDTLLVREAKGRSRVELAEMTGLSPEAVASRLDALLADRDWLSARQEERLWFLQLEGMFQELHSRFSSASDKNVSDMIRAASQVLQMSRDARKEREALENEIGKITAEHARVFGCAFDVALRHVTGELQERYRIDDSEIEALVEDGLRAARRRLAEDTAAE